MQPVLMLGFTSAFFILPHVLAAKGGGVAEAYCGRVLGLCIGGAATLFAVGLLMVVAVATTDKGASLYVPVAWFVSLGLSSLAIGVVGGSLVANRNARNAVVHTSIALITLFYLFAGLVFSGV